MADSGFSSLSLPNALVDRVDAFVEAQGGVYRSRADVARQAILAFLEARQARPATEPLVPGA